MKTRIFIMLFLLALFFCSLTINYERIFEFKDFNLIEVSIEDRNQSKIRISPRKVQVSEEITFYFEDIKEMNNLIKMDFYIVKNPSLYEVNNITYYKENYTHKVNLYEKLDKIGEDSFDYETPLGKEGEYIFAFVYGNSTDEDYYIGEGNVIVKEKFNPLFSFENIKDNLKKLGFIGYSEEDFFKEKEENKNKSKDNQTSI